MFSAYIDPLKTAGLFQGVATPDLLAMLGCLEPKLNTYRRNDFIAVSGEEFESLGIILQGEAAVIKENATGDRIVIDILEPGALCGAEVVFTKEPVWPNSVVAQKASEVLFISRQKILGQCYKVCLHHRLIIENMLRIVSEKAMLLNKKVEYLTIKSMRGKIAAFLLDYYRKTGQAIFTLPLNRNAMAEFLNVSRPSMSREMGRMKEEGIIDYHLSTIRIKDLDALKKTAG
ncbi:MAG TPA: Crp/Fnr family transcriptional regulator [Bacillota bacterium]